MSGVTARIADRFCIVWRMPAARRSRMLWTVARRGERARPARQESAARSPRDEAPIRKRGECRAKEKTGMLPKGFLGRFLLTAIVVFIGLIVWAALATHR